MNIENFLDFKKHHMCIKYGYLYVRVHMYMHMYEREGARTPIIDSNFEI